MTRLTHRLNPTITAIIVGVILTGCGTADKSSPAAQSSQPVEASPVAPSASLTPEDGGIVIPITITATSVTPPSHTVKVGVNKPVTLRITASAPGEIHVHSTPEQMIAYKAGTSEVILNFKVPGTVEVEDHALDQEIVQIQVN